MSVRRGVNGRALPLHKFEIQVDYHDGQGIRTIVQEAKIRLSRRAIMLRLTIGDIEESLAKNGMGNSMLCAMSQSCKRQRAQFPHPTVGPIDWLTKTAFVASRVDKNNVIIECWKYEHRDDIAKLFDTVAGLRKLRERAEANGGYIDVKLLPARNRVGEARTGGHSRNSDGARTRVRNLSKGSKLRFANAYAGRALSLRRPPVAAE